MNSGAKQKPEPERSRRGCINREWIFLSITALMLMATAARPAHGQTATVQVLYIFCSGNSCPDGESPFGSLVQGLDGNLYGTTAAGGANGQGTIFRITPSGSITTLYSFCSQPGCSDGESPQANLILGTDGNFYGTTSNGGTGGGTPFQITPAGTLTTLAGFTSCSVLPCGPSTPISALVQGTDGNFYGTSKGGGTNGLGTIFKITPGGTSTVLYSFCSQTNCSDGSGPFAGLVEGTDGNFYGTTAHGGNSTGNGTVFQVTPAGALTTLYAFCAGLANPCPDGSVPTMPLIFGKDGNFYGTTSTGNNSGTLFKITSTGTLTTIYTFCREGFPCAATGTIPSWLFQASDGNFYGTTQSGGTNNSGIIFQITPAGTFTNLYSFPAENPFGELPVSPPIQASDGSFYGTTTGGGVGVGQGTVYKLVVPGLSSTVPNVVDLPQATAQSDITGAGLVVGTVTQQSSNTVPSRDVISQSPGAGTSVPSNSAVNLVISTGPSATLTSVTVTPANPTVTAGNTVQFTATGNYSDGSTQNLTTSVTWGAVSSSVATISNAPGSQGLATAVAVGQTAIMATSGSVSGSTTLTVTSSTGPPPESLADSETITLSDTPFLITMPQLLNITAPVAYYSVSSLGFGTVAPGQTSTQTFLLSNIGNSPLSVSSESITGSAFTLTQLACSNGAASLPTNLGPADGCVFTISYLAPSGSAATGTITITDNALLTNAATSSGSGTTFTQSIPLDGSGGSGAPGPLPPVTQQITDDESITVTDTVAFQTLDLSSVQLSIAPTGPVAAGTPVTMTAAVTSLVSGASATPTGVVTFSNGGNAIGGAPLTNGVATLVTSTLPSGTDSITASYSGDSNFSFSTSGPQTITVNQPDYLIVANPNTLTLAAGQSGSTTITVTPLGFTGTVTVSCAGLPAYVTCSFNPSSGSLNFNGGAFTAQTLTLTVSVAPTIGMARQNGLVLASLIAPFGLIAFVPMIGVRRKKLARRRTLSGILAVVAVFLTVWMAGCGGRPGSTPPPPGEQKITINASGSSSSGAVSHQLQFTITITN